LITEDQVIRATRAYLEGAGFKLVRSNEANLRRRGVDLEMTSPHGARLSIEAKGQTSSLESSNRFGKEFSRAQKRNHLGEALVAVMAPKRPGGSWGIALPGDEYHVELIQRAEPPLRRMGLLVFVVEPSREKARLLVGTLPG
jgi:hypothetical protein